MAIRKSSKLLLVVGTCCVVALLLVHQATFTVDVDHFVVMPKSTSVQRSTKQTTVSSESSLNHPLNQPAADAVIHFITVQTKSSAAWCRMLISAHLSGNISVVNLAWGAKYAHIKRPQWIRTFLDKLADEDVIVFADGGDTIYTGTPGSELGDMFRKLTASSKASHSPRDVKNGKQLHPVLFNAEANCYHQQTFGGSWGVKKGRCLSAYKRFDPNVTSPYRYLNGGGWIARVWAAKIVFDAALVIIRKDSGWWCDQSVLGKLLLSQSLAPGILGLDTQNRFFLPTYHLRPSRDFCDDAVPEEGEIKPQLKMCHSNNIPSIVHFNGKSEGAFTSDVIRRTSWHTKYRRYNSEEKRVIVGQIASGLVLLGHEQRRATIADVCPRLTFPM